MGTEVFYEVYHAGDTVTDQATGAPGTHSTLVGDKGDVSDTVFAEKVAKPVHLQAATPDNLTALLANTANPANRMDPYGAPKFVFLYVGDHGGLDNKTFAKPGFRPDPLLVPNFHIEPGMTIYGEGR